MINVHNKVDDGMRECVHALSYKLMNSTVNTIYITSSSLA